MRPLFYLRLNLEEADKVLGLELGADDYITKPFVTEDILKMVEKWLQVSKSN